MSIHFSPIFCSLRRINIGFFFLNLIFLKILLFNLIQLHFLLSFVSFLHTLKLLLFFYLLLYKEETKLDHRFFPENHRVEVYLVYNFTFFFLSFHRIPANCPHWSSRFTFKIRNTFFHSFFQINSSNQCDPLLLQSFLTRKFSSKKIEPYILSQYYI